MQVPRQRGGLDELDIIAALLDGQPPEQWYNEMLGGSDEDLASDDEDDTRSQESTDDDGSQGAGHAGNHIPGGAEAAGAAGVGAAGAGAAGAGAVGAGPPAGAAGGLGAEAANDVGAGAAGDVGAGVAGDVGAGAAGAAVGAAAGAEGAQPAIRPRLPKRPTARWYLDHGHWTLHCLTNVTVLQASYTLLKIKVDYTIHDTAFDTMLKAMSAMLPDGHFLPG